MISTRSVHFTLASQGITQKIMAVLAFWTCIGLFTATVRADVTVDCDAGDTIAGGLAQDNVVFVKGTCNENVVVSNSGVQLLADPAGATINGPDPTQNTITVNGSRVTIDGLTGGITITGGSNGVTADGATTVRNVTITSGRSGIVFFQSANGTVDNCTIQGNPRHGVVIEGGSATIINSTISGNTRDGIGLFRGGNARIGITSANQYASNTITNNGSSGIEISLGNAYIGGNTISGNGTDTGSTLRYGILLDHSSAVIVGNNTITNNAGSGILVAAGTVLIGDAGFGLPTMNTITGNGASLLVGNGGIWGFLGSSLDIRDATISNNTGNGVFLTTQSRARMFNDTIQGNSVDGIAATLGSGVLLQMPTVLVTNNARFGLLCVDRLLSRYFGDISGIHDNGQDQVSCDPFF